MFIFQLVSKTGKKAPKCFKEHEQSKCHCAALTYEVVTPKCGDVAEMNNHEVLKRRYNERQYFKVVMECIQYLARQGMALRGDEGNDNLTQLLLATTWKGSSLYC